MKSIIPFAALAVLLIVAPNWCFALRSIGIVSKDEANQLGLEVRAVGGDSEQTWLELEFKAQGKLKAFHHVELDIRDGNKMQVSWLPLQHRRLESGRVLVRFLANPGYLDKITLTIVVGDLTEAGYEVRVKDHLEPQKAPLTHRDSPNFAAASG